MGRAPNPDNVVQLRGNPGHRPERESIEVEASAPKCPPWLHPEAKREWKRICAELVQYGLVTQLDRAVLAAHCSAWALFRLAETHFNEKSPVSGETGHVVETPNEYLQQSVWMQIRNKAIDQLVATGREFGLTPAARSRVNVRQPETGDLFDDL